MSKPLFDMPLIEWLYKALRAEIGVVIRTTNFARTRAKLYSARKIAQDPSLDQISLIQSPTDDGEIWLVKKGPSDAS